jgi:hypothetical protein
LNPDWTLRLPLLGDLLGLPIPDNNVTAAFDPRLRQEALFTLVVDMLQHWAGNGRCSCCLKTSTGWMKARSI